MARMKAEKFARRFAMHWPKQSVRYELRGAPILPSRLTCDDATSRCANTSVDAAVHAVLPAMFRARGRSNMLRWPRARCIGPSPDAVQDRPAGPGGVCREDRLAHGAWVAWLERLGDSVAFGHPRIGCRKYADKAWLAVKTTSLDSLSAGVARFSVRLRWSPSSAARPVLRVLRYEARRIGLRFVVLPRDKHNQKREAVTSLFLRDEKRRHRQTVRSGGWRWAPLAGCPDVEQLVPVKHDGVAP